MPLHDFEQRTDIREGIDIITRRTEKAVKTERIPVEPGEVQEIVTEIFGSEKPKITHFIPLIAQGILRSRHLHEIVQSQETNNIGEQGTVPTGEMQPNTPVTLP
jgi:hypothetical protein